MHMRSLGWWCVAGALVLSACSFRTASSPSTAASSSTPTAVALQSATAEQPTTTTPSATFIPTQPAVTARATTTSLPTSTTAQAVEPTIAAIRSQYATINAELPQYSKIEKDAPNFSTEGGTLEAYQAGNALRKIVLRYFGELGRGTEEYYYWDEQLFFVFRIESEYDQPFGKVVGTKEQRFYFADDQLIRWLDEQKQPVAPGEPTYQEAERDLLDRSQQLIALARTTD